MKYIIGDIHANVTELKKILELIRPTKEDKLIFLGDYIDKHPYTNQTLALLERLDHHCDCVFIKGNHDYVWQRYLDFKDLSRQGFLLHFGGVAALSQLSPHPVKLIKENRIDQIKKLLKSYIYLFARMVDYAIVDQYLALHAGLLPSQLRQSKLTFTELNYFIRPDQINLTEKYLGRYRAVAAHTHLSTRPVTKPGYINIDLGAGEQGYIGALCVEKQEVLRSDGKVYKVT